MATSLSLPEYGSEVTVRKRTPADWLWSAVGFGGVACIVVALYLYYPQIFPPEGDRGNGERAREYLATAREKRAAGDPAGALACLAAAETLTVQNPGEFDDAWCEELQTEIRSVRLELAERHWASGTVKLEAGDAAGAAREYEAAVFCSREDQERNPVYLNGLGEVLLSLGDEVRAKRAWLAALNQQFAFAKPYVNLARWCESKGDIRAALSGYRAALAFHPEPVPEGLGAKVSELTESLGEEMDEEARRFRKRLRANPADCEAFHRLLVEKLRITRSSEDAPPDAGIKASVLAIGGEIGDLSGLRERQESAVRDRPGYVVDRAGLGMVLLLLGEFERAGEVFEAAAKLSESDRTTLLGGALSDLLRGAEDGTRIEKAATIFRRNSIAWIALGAHRVRNSEDGSACPALLNALQFDPGMPEVYRLLGQAFAGEGREEDREAALRAYRRIR